MTPCAAVGRCERPCAAVNAFQLADGDDLTAAVLEAGEALDVRRWGLTSAQLYRLGELAIAAGFGRALLESDHLHLQMP